MARIKLYFHTGSANHGCEAIVRSTHKILNGQEIDLFSFAPEEDRKFQINKIVNVCDDTDQPLKKGLLYFLSAFQFKFFGKTILNTKLRHRHFFESVKRNDICLSIGGDNYCYQGIEQLKDYNKILNSQGAKTVLWGCSLEENLAEKIKDDLNRYSLIVTRETLTYESIKSAGVSTPVKLCPDPAFQLDIAEVKYPEGFDNGNIVGINLSPVILTFANSELIMKNYENLISHVLENPNSRVALIPHMLKAKSSDRKILEILYEKFKDSPRILLIDDHNCMEMKGFISKCRFFVGARTHAAIAAYSTSVPCLAISYSMKAKGIAKDIFGTFENYVCPVQNLKSENEILQAFKWMEDNENAILSQYQNVMPAYKKVALEAERHLKKIL